MTERFEWAEYRKLLELTPEAIAQGLGSHAEKWEQLYDDLIPLDLREGVYFILLSSDQPVETVLYTWDPVNVLGLKIRTKGDKSTIRHDAYGGIKKAEGVVDHAGQKGVVFTIGNGVELMVMEDGYISLDVKPESNIEIDAPKKKRLSFLRRGK